MPVLQTPGARLSYSKAGRGPAVLLIQGVGVIGECWRPQVDGLRDAFTLIPFDNRGIGDSTIEDGVLTIEAMARDALAIMDAEAIDRFHVAGHSMGGVIAQEVALQAPARVKSLSLLCTFVRGRDAVKVTLDTLWIGIRTKVGTRAMRRRAFLRAILPESFLAQADTDQLAAELAALFGHDLADQPPIAMRQLGALSVYDAGARLATLAAIPTIVGSAEHDRIARLPTGRALAAAIPGARFVEFRGAGHALPIQQAADVNAWLRAHWNHL